MVKHKLAYSTPESLSVHHYFLDTNRAATYTPRGCVVTILPPKKPHDYSECEQFIPLKRRTVRVERKARTITTTQVNHFSHVPNFQTNRPSLLV